MDGYKSRVEGILGDDPYVYSSVSVDGSSYDSNQHQAIIDVVDNVFFKWYEL